MRTRIRTPRRSFLPAALSLFAVLFAVRPAAADPARGDAIAFAAHVTATKLRHRWDDARAKDSRLASCLEPKVAEAMMLISRIDLKRVELRDGSDLERAHAASALETLFARRAELEAESTACAPHVYSATIGTRVTMTMRRSIAAFEPGFGNPAEPELLRALLGPMTAR